MPKYDPYGVNFLNPKYRAREDKRQDNSFHKIECPVTRVSHITYPDNVTHCPWCKVELCQR
jgi:hypothetical protein